MQHKKQDRKITVALYKSSIEKAERTLIRSAFYLEEAL
jgi:hypothetical protein